MQDEFANRLDSFDRSLAVLDLPEHKPLWENQPPLAVTTKVGEARTMVGELKTAQQKQEAGTGGATAEKDREETELEEAAGILAEALVIYYTDKGQETEAGEVNLTESDWTKLRDQQLLAKSQLVIDRATVLSSGATAVDAAKYGITPAAVLSVTKERTDYDNIVNAPGVTIAVRKALTTGFRPAFKLTEKKFAEVDKLIRQFRTTAAGRTMIAAWNAARIIKDAGHAGGGEAPANPTPTPTPTPTP